MSDARPQFQYDGTRLDVIVDRYQATVSVVVDGVPGESPAERLLETCRELVQEGVVRADGVEPDQVEFRVHGGVIEASVPGRGWFELRTRSVDHDLLLSLQALDLVAQLTGQPPGLRWKPGLIAI